MTELVFCSLSHRATIKVSSGLGFHLQALSAPLSSLFIGRIQFPVAVGPRLPEVPCHVALSAARQFTPPWLVGGVYYCFDSLFLKGLT
jgi:hypothetical protein